MLSANAAAARAVAAKTVIPGQTANASTSGTTRKSVASGTADTAVYAGGSVLSHVKIVPVFWGSGVDTTVQNGIVPFYDAVTDSSYIDIAEEYSTDKQRIGRGSATSAVTITPTTTGSTLTDAQIQAELASQIGSGNLPAPDDDTLYAVHFPASVTSITEPSGTASCVPGGFCAYHYGTTQTIAGTATTFQYMVLPDFGAPGTGCTAICGGGTMMQSVTRAASHEIMEAVTDPQPFTGWSPEIGDPTSCNGTSATITAADSTVYTVQPIWSNFAQACVSSPKPNRMSHEWQLTAGGAWTPGASTLAVGAAHDVAAATNSDGRLEVFHVGDDGNIYHEWQNSPGGGWSDAVGLNVGGARAVAATRNADGRLEVFHIGNDGNIYHEWQNSAGGDWSGPTNLNVGQAHALAAARNADGRLEVFHVGDDGNIYHEWQNAAGADWSGPTNLNVGQAHALAAAQNADGRLEVFHVGDDGNLYHEWQNAAGADWSGPTNLNVGGAHAVAAEVNADGRLEVAHVGDDGNLYHEWQNSAGGDWSGPVGFDVGQAVALALAQNSDGRLELFNIR